MKKISFLLLSLFFVTDLLACPYCAGSSQGGKDSTTTFVLAGFIVAIYVPYYIIFRMIKKHNALKEAHASSGSTDA